MLFTLFLGLSVGPTAAVENQLPPPCGMGVLASSIGTDFSPEELAQIVHDRGFSPVVIDWAWIAAHWEQPISRRSTDSWTWSSRSTCPWPPCIAHAFSIIPPSPSKSKAMASRWSTTGLHLLLQPEARHWGEAWGTRILRKCPQINEIIIYNPLNQCESAACRRPGKSPLRNYDTVWKFSRRGEAGLAAERPEVQLGVVFVSDPDVLEARARRSWTSRIRSCS